MHIKLDKQRMEVVAVCGILEKYAPSKEIRDMHRRLRSLNTKMSAFLKNEVEPELAKIEAIIEAENAKHVKKAGVKALE